MSDLPSADTLSVTDLMLRIKAIDRSATLEFSDYTRKWYVGGRIEVSNGVMLTGITEHRDSPEEAVRAFFDRLTNVPASQVLVTHADHDNRRHWRWNGAAFVESSPVR